MSYVSVVVATDGRANSLATTLRSLRRLEHAGYEVIVVQGPTEDGTSKTLEPYLPRIKVARCSERNLSRSRNLGIALAAGAIVAFLDDDAIAEPEWLAELTAPFVDASVGAAGGFVLDHTGGAYQYKFATTDRLARADLSWQRPAPELCFPQTASFPHPLGANSAFRRTALVQAGCFDEEYDYFLDETDMCCRLVDAGWAIAQVAGAHVHHKYQASALRTEQKVLSGWFSVVKNKAYYAIQNGCGHHGMLEIISELRTFIDGLDTSLAWAIGAGHLHVADRQRFHREVDLALEVGMRRGLSRERKLPEAAMFADPPPFVSFADTVPQDGRRTFIFSSQEYPPTLVGGVGRYVHQLARGIADAGDHSHVVTRGGERLTVDLEDGVWVHRVPVESDVRGAFAKDLPQHIAAYSEAVRATVSAIAARRSVACVYCPIWDAEGAAVLAEGAVPLVTGLQTTLRFWLESNPARAADPAFRAGFVAPMLCAETSLLLHSGALHAISQAIADDIGGIYGVDLSQRASVVPLGLEDAARAAALAPAVDGYPRILFVGRLETRKGIDVLFDAIRLVLPQFPSARLDIVGNDTIPGPDGRTYRQVFDADRTMDAVRAQVRFHGLAGEPELRGFYAASDIVVAPSRFESFGLVLLEAMIFGKAMIGCHAGGMPEVIEDGVSGLLATPGDCESLAACLRRLLHEPETRAQLGRAARVRYEARFTPEAMAAGVKTLMLKAAAR